MHLGKYRLTPTEKNMEYEIQCNKKEENEKIMNALVSKILMNFSLLITAHNG